MEKVFRIVPRAEIFEKTGIQFLNFNTLFQLYSDADAAGALTMLLLPDLVNYFLTGRPAAEYTNATTTQMVNAATREWDSDLLLDWISEKDFCQRSFLREPVSAR